MPITVYRFVLVALAAGTHPKVAQERLGHHSAAFTLDFYSSVVPSMQREAVTKLAEQIG